MTDQRSGTETQEGAVPGRLTCYRCGAVLGEGASRCPECGRPQTRRCYCGADIPVTETKCPNCGADWSKSSRARRRSHSTKVNWGRLGLYMLAGALAVIGIAALVNSVVGGLALRSLPGARHGLPGSFLERLGLAVMTVQEVLLHLFQRVSSLGGGPAVGVVLIAAGAGLGALVYLQRSGAVKLRLPLWHSSGSHHGHGSGRKRASRRRRADGY